MFLISHQLPNADRPTTLNSQRKDDGSFMYMFNRPPTQHAAALVNEVDGIPLTLKGAARAAGFEVFTTGEYSADVTRTVEAARDDIRQTLIDAHTHGEDIVKYEDDLNALLRILGMPKYEGKWCVEVSLNGEFLGEFIVTAKSAAHAEEIISEAIRPVSMYVPLKFVAEGDGVERKTVSLDFDLEKFLEDAEWTFEVTEYRS